MARRKQRLPDGITQLSILDPLGEEKLPGPLLQSHNLCWMGDAYHRWRTTATPSIRVCEDCGKEEFVVRSL